MTNTLRVQIDSGQRETSAEAFLHVLQATIDALRELDKVSSRFGSESVEWQIVDAGKNSPLFTSIGWSALPSPNENGTHGDENIQDFVAGLSHLERSNTCPQKFNATSLRIVAKFIHSYSRGVQGIRFEDATGRAASVSRALTQNANYALRVLELQSAGLSKETVEYGSIEGRLVGLSMQAAKNRDKVTIVDDLTREEVPCYFHDDLVEQQAREFWKHRVIVTGEMSVDRESGKTTKLKVDEISPLSERNELPQMEDLHGIDITHGIESARYISDLRNAE